MANTFRPKEVLKEAELAEKSGNVRVASKLYHTLALHLSKRSNWSEAYQLLEKAIVLSKKSARLYVLKARLASKMGQSEDCLHSLKAFISYSLEKEKLVEYVSYLEDQLKDDPKLRKLFFEELLKLERTTSFAFTGLARTCIELGDFERAKSVLLDCLKTKDQPAKTTELLHYVLRATHAEHAIGFVDKFERGELGHSELVSLLGGNRETKVQVVLSDIEGTKDLKGLIADLERELGVTVQQDLDSVKPLVHEFRKRANLVLGNDAKARIDLSLAFYEMGLYQDSIEELKTISEIDPLYLESLCLQGKISIAQGADLAALNCYLKVLRESRAEGEVVKDALYQMVEIYSRINDFGKVLETAVRLEKMDPVYREIHRLKIGIEEMSRR